MGKEATFGTAVGPTTFLPMSGCTIEEDPGWFSPQVMMGTRDLQVFNVYGEAKFTGAIDGPLFPSNGLQLLVAAIGTDAVTGTVAPYTHTISQANTLQSVTVEKNVGGHESLQFAGCRVNKYSLKAPVGNAPVEVSVDVFGQSAAVLATPAAVSVTNELPFVFAEASLSLFGNARADVTNIQLDIENGLKETYTYSGQHGPSFITPVTVHVTGTFDVVWAGFDTAGYADFNNMVNGSLGQLQLTLTHPSSGGSVQITLPQVVLSKFANDIKIADVVLSTLTFEASKTLPTGYTVQAVVNNSVSTAY